MNKPNKKEVTIKMGSWAMPLFFLFLILKLTNTIDWSWWWVTSPLWLPIATVLAFVGIFFVIIAVIGIFVLIFDR